MLPTHLRYYLHKGTCLAMKKHLGADSGLSSFMQHFNLYWLTLVRFLVNWCKSLKDDQEIFLELSTKVLSSITAANVATDCQDGVQHKYSVHYPSNNFLWGSLANNLRAYNRETILNFSIMLNKLGSLIFEMNLLWLSNILLFDRDAVKLNFEKYMFL